MSVVRGRRRHPHKTTLACGPRQEHVEMDTKITRKRFLVSLFGSTAAVLLDGCGGGGGYSGTTSPMPPPPPPAASCGASGSAIANNHAAPYMHALTFAKTDVDLTSAQTYSIQGSALHDHTITLSAAQLATLKAGGSVTVTSTSTDAPGIGPHTHDVMVTCT
jgi:hypothetical protein